MRASTVTVCTLAALTTLQADAESAAPVAAPLPASELRVDETHAVPPLPVATIIPPEALLTSTLEAPRPPAPPTLGGISSNPSPPELRDLGGDATLRSAASTNQSSTPISTELNPIFAHFTDIEGHWAQSQIQTLQQAGIVYGFADQTFRPDEPITSPHLARILQQAIAKHGIGFLIHFSNGFFKANQRLSQTLTRAEVVTLAYQALTESGAIAPENTPFEQPFELLAYGTGADTDRAELGSVLVAQTELTPPTIAPPTTQEPSSQPPDSIELPQVPVAQASTPIPVPVPVAPESNSAPLPVPQPPAIDGDTPPATSPDGLTVPPTTTPNGLTVVSIPASGFPVTAAPANPTGVSSQLGTLLQGNDAEQLRDYWTALCQSNAPDLGEALQACDQLLAINPRDAAVWIIRGDVMFKLNKFAEAFASYDRAFASTPATSNLHTNRCRALSALGQQEAAIAECDKAIQLDKSWEDETPAIAWYTKGTALKRLGKNEDALAAYDKALALAPSYSLAWAEQCRVLSEVGKQEAAIASCDRALSTNGDWGNRTPAIAWYHRGLALSRLDREQEAVAAYDKALEINPKDASIWTKQGTLLGELGKHTEALLSHDQALKISPNYSLALVNRCASLNKLGKYEEALAACEQAINGDGRWNELGITYAWDQRGTALAGLGKLEEGLASVDRAVALKADYIEAWSNRSVILWRMKQYTEALAAADRAVSIKADYSQGWFNKGRILRTMERYEAAIDAYDQALKGDVNPNDKPTLADIWANRSAALWRLGKYQEALESTQQAVKIDPESPLGWFNQGSILMSLKKPREAAIAYEQATQLDPDDVYAWIGQGIALEKTGRYKEALATLDEALKIEPEQPLAVQSRDAVLKKLKPERSQPVKDEEEG
jgi:tetratricopeptide (TPR) repeat protein